MALQVRTKFQLVKGVLSFIFCALIIILNPTSLFSQFVGNGSSGALTVSSNTTINTAGNGMSDITVTAAAGTSTLTMSSTTGFAANDYVMVIQMIGTGVGNYERTKISSVTSGTVLTLLGPLVKTYTKTGATSVAQVIRMPQYSSVTVNNTFTLSNPAWNGTTGGVLAFYCSGTVTVTGGTGAIDMTGLGFSGGSVGTGGTYAGASSNAGNPGGAGSGRNGGTAGTNASTAGGGSNGTPASSGSPSEFATIELGSGGGGGGGGSSSTDGGSAGFGNNPGCAGAGGGFPDNSSVAGATGTAGGAGGAGGGIIWIACNALTGTGLIKANGAVGANGGTGATGGTGGTGGSGGNVLVRTDNATSGAPYVCYFTASTGSAGGNGGVGGKGSNGGGGGAGGVIFLGVVAGNNSFSGTTSASGGGGGSVGSGGGAGPAGFGGFGGLSGNEEFGFGYGCDMCPGGTCAGCAITPATCGDCTISYSSVRASNGSAGSAGAAGSNAGTAGSAGKTSATTPPLPIELISFTGYNQNSINILNWETASETNNNYFVVEHAVDGISFSDVTKIKGAGTTSQAQYYSAVDEAPFFPLSFYRLKQIDFDGKFSYSKTIAVYKSQNDRNFNIIPNPAKNNVTVTFYSADQDVAHIKIFDAQGKLVYSEKSEAIKGENAVLINLSEFSTGLYSVSVFVNDKVCNGKLVKQ